MQSPPAGVLGSQLGARARAEFHGERIVEMHMQRLGGKEQLLAQVYSAIATRRDDTVELALRAYGAPRPAGMAVCAGCLPAVGRTHSKTLAARRTHSKPAAGLGAAGLQRAPRTRRAGHRQAGRGGHKHSEPGGGPGCGQGRPRVAPACTAGAARSRRASMYGASMHGASMHGASMHGASMQRDDAARRAAGKDMVGALGAEVDRLESEIKRVMPGIRHIDLARPRTRDAYLMPSCTVWHACRRPGSCERWERKC